MEKEKLETLAAKLLRDYPVTTARLADLSAAGHDLALLRAAVTRYAKVPAANRHFVLRMTGENLVVTPMSAASPDERMQGQPAKRR